VKVEVKGRVVKKQDDELNTVVEGGITRDEKPLSPRNCHRLPILMVSDDLQKL
jgi:hypothetical protein